MACVGRSRHARRAEGRGVTSLVQSPTDCTGLPDIRFRCARYVLGMALSRRVLVRLVVAVLAISLSSQLLEGQALRCAEMNRAMQSSHVQPTHAGDAVTTYDQHSQRVPQPSSCLLSALCLSTPAIVASAPVSVNSAFAPLAIPFALTHPEARSPRPDFPPPKI
jgi:hypothetical protein